MSFSYEQVIEASKEYFNGEELPAKVFADKYALRNEENELLEVTPDDMHRRLAREFARIEATKFKEPYSEDAIYNLFKNYACIIPQGSPIYGIGNPYQITSISNCFVTDSPKDSYGGITKIDEELAQISKRRGGVGVDLSTLRPNGMRTRNSSRSSTGTKSWMQRYSNTIREVGQDGRRGALMLSISVHHPDVLIFSSAKDNDKDVTGANISIRLSDEFLTAVENDIEYEQRWPVNSVTPKFSQKIKAKDVWNKIIHSAWLRAEPGLLFWDNIINDSPADCYDQFKTVSTNPCGEIPLSPYDSCRLMAINLFSCVVNPYKDNAYFDYGQLYIYAQISQRLMDDLVDLEIECIDRILAKLAEDPEEVEVKQREISLWQRIRAACVNGRRTGLGITVLGDTLAALGIQYGSDDSVEKTEQIYQTLKFGSYRSSVDMAKELGAFPVWDWEKEKNNPFINRIKYETDTYGCIYGKNLYEDIKKYGRRNIANLTTAPTGTISTQASLNVNGTLFFNTTSGIEPLFKTHYVRRKKGNPGDTNFRSDFVDQTGDHWMEFPVYHSGVKAWMYATGKDKIEDSPYYNATAETIIWTQRAKLQAAAQRHVDHSISSTVNLPENTTEEEVAAIYTEAWKSGCKGITIYRENCRTGVLIDAKKESPKIEERPREVPCEVHHATVKGQSYFILVGMVDGRPYEVFAGKNGILDKAIKTGTIIRKKKRFYKAVFDDDFELAPITACCSEQEETISRLTSALLRSNANIHLIVQQLERVSGDMHSFAKALARVLKKFIPDGTKEIGEVCQECKQESIIRSDGCIRCSQCGWSKCS